MGLISNIVHYSNTAAKALKEYDNDLFPNIHALLKICDMYRDYSEGLVPQYFDVSFDIVKLLLYNLIQTVVFDKCNIQFLPCTLPLQFLISHVLLLSFPYTK